MGTKGIQIVELDVSDLIADLNRAYADEWLAAYAYTHMAQVVTGRPAAKFLAESLKDTAKDELEHQDELAERITQLGGKPLAALTRLSVPFLQGSCEFISGDSPAEIAVGVVQRLRAERLIP